MRNMISLFLIVVTLHLAKAECPHNAPDLTAWSSMASGASEMMPLTINTKILLDQSPGFDIGGITIVDGGQLVFSPDTDITLRTLFIEITEGGRLDIGSEDCPFYGNSIIQLIGDVNVTYSVPGFGRKFIGVNEGGTLEIHGKKKQPWTKLTRTLHHLTPDEFTTYDKIGEEGRGFVVYSINPATGVSDRERQIFNIGSGSHKGVRRETEKFQTFVNDIPDGNIVMMGVRKFIVDRNNEVDRSDFYDVVETLGYGSVTGASKIRDIVFYDSFAMIVVKGDPSQTVEGFEPYRVDGLHQTSTATFIDEATKLKYFVKSYTRAIGFGASFAEFEVSRTDLSIPVLTVTDDVTSWEDGDKVFITSTDYDWEQLEIGTVRTCDVCQTNQFKVDLTPKFTHYGNIFKNVDMRAEVGLLSRNIVIEGVVEDDGDEFGGHIKVLKGFKNVHIEGAEIRHMGQSQTLGNYPIHWHMCEDVDDPALYPNPTYARQNSIHSTYARCVTVHATHGAKVTDNVCYRSKGHAYFLEDGGEKRTVLRGNLGVGQVRAELTPTDNLPSTFWITNPLTTVENNVAAGGEGIGMWYIFPDEPLGPSKGKGYMAPNEARHTAIDSFLNNVIHSNKWDGLRFDDRMDENGTKLGNNMYQPLMDPLDETSGDKKVVLSKLTAYKNGRSNAWVRGGMIEVTQSSFSDSVAGMILLRYRSGSQSVLNSVFIGDSDNKGVPEIGLDRSIPNDRMTSPHYQEIHPSVLESDNDSP